MSKSEYWAPGQIRSAFIALLLKAKFGNSIIYKYKSHPGQSIIQEQRKWSLKYILDLNYNFANHFPMNHWTICGEERSVQIIIVNLRQLSTVRPSTKRWSNPYPTNCVGGDTVNTYELFVCRHCNRVLWFIRPRYSQGKTTTTFRFTFNTLARRTHEVSNGSEQLAIQKIIVHSRCMWSSNGKLASTASPPHTDWIQFTGQRDYEAIAIYKSVPHDQ